MTTYLVNETWECQTYEQVLDLLIEMSFSDDGGSITIEVVFES